MDGRTMVLVLELLLCREVWIGDGYGGGRWVRLLLRVEVPR